MLGLIPMQHRYQFNTQQMPKRLSNKLRCSKLFCANILLNNVARARFATHSRRTKTHKPNVTQRICLEIFSRYDSISLMFYEAF